MTASPARAGAPTTGHLQYTLWAVLRRDPANRVNPKGDVTSAVAAVEAADVTIRGWYDASSIRANADLMVWLHGARPEKLQWALRELHRSSLLTSLLPTWNALGVHRDAEFSANHLPSFMKGTAPAKWLTLYPFVRSYEWYLLPDDERRAMLGYHGGKGSEHAQVLANTVAAFALGDYEWILALEAPELVDLVDLMRHLRETDARRHVRKEVPFYAGRRIEANEIAQILT